MSNIKKKLIPYVPSLILMALVVLAIVLTSLDRLAQNQRFVDEFNRKVPPALQQENIADIRDIMPGCSFYLDVSDYAYLWNFRDRYGLANMPVPPEDYHNTGRFVSSLMEQFKGVEEYAREQGLSRDEVAAVLNRAFAAEQLDLVRLVQLEVQ